VPTPGDYDDGEIGGMMIGRGNRSTRRKPAPVPLELWHCQLKTYSTKEIERRKSGGGGKGQATFYFFRF
jgi:hypothetical protein